MMGLHTTFPARAAATPASEFDRRMEAESALHDAARLLTAVDRIIEHSEELQRPGEFEIIRTLIDRISTEVRTALNAI